MSEEVGKGFARRVTKLNLAKFAALLRDRTKEPSGPPPGSSTDESVAAQSLFNGSRVRVALPFTFPWDTPGTTTATGTSSPEPGSTEEEISDDPGASHAVLIAEIPGPGRWSQASFSRNVFFEFFGAGPINLNYIDAHGTLIHETENPIVKKSSNYCYELGAAAGLEYPSGNVGRPISVFLRIGPQQFQYKLVMPSDPDYPLLVMFLANNWSGPAGRMRRVTTDLDTLLGIWPAARLPL